MSASEDKDVKIAKLEKEIAVLEKELAKLRIYKAKFTDERKQWLKQNWAEHSPVYNAQRRKRRLALKLAKSWPTMAVPADLRALFGGKTEVTLPQSRNTWSDRHTKEWSKLSESSSKQYIRNTRTLMDHMGYEEVPIGTDPIALADNLLGREDFDIWAVVREASDEVYSAGIRNNFAKGLLGVLNAKVRALEAEGDVAGEARVALLALIAQQINADTKREVGDKHHEQLHSVVSEANTAEWADWKVKAGAFVTEGMRAPRSFESKRDAMIVAVYSKIPPIRTNWSDVQVVKSEPPKGDEANSLLIRPDGGIDTFWGHFKNRDSFKSELPLKIPIESPELVKLLTRYVKLLKGTWLFPKYNTADSPCFPSAGFGKLIGDITTGIVGKRFTPQRMRISFISHWHETHKGAFKVKEIIAVMRQLHQKDVATHLSYVKSKGGEEGLAAEALIEAGLDGLYEEEEAE